MKLKSLTCLSVGLLFAIPSLALAQQANKPPVLLAKQNKDKKSTPLKVSQFSAEVVVTGNTAETKMTMTFRNDTDRVLEGELVFPLNEGTTVSSYALEVNGKMRQGVVVEKNFARSAYEDTIRKQIDPGLVEWTKGNNFRTRIYPIPAKGTKTLSISYEETLQNAANDPASLAYQLPLAFAEKMDHFSLKVRVIKPDGKQKIIVENNAGLDFKVQDQNQWAIDTKQKNFTANKTLSLKLPKEDLAKVMTFKATDGKHFFYVVDDAIKPQKESARLVPKRVKIIWDASHSGATRDHKKEQTVLKHYLNQPGIESIELVVLRNELSTAGTFKADAAGLEMLFNAISSQRYDGATRMGLINLKQSKADAVILVSDGVATLGKTEALGNQLGKAPVFTLHASQSAEHALLKSIALRSQGAYINLTKVDEKSAHHRLTQQTFSLISVTGKGVTESYPSIATPVSGSMSVAGLLEGESTELTLNYGVAGKVITKHTFTLNTAAATPDASRIKRLWAQKKLAELELNPKQNEEHIIAVAKENKIVTRYTSLLVLDRLEDYVRYAIAPPEPELRKEYERLLKQQPEEKEADAEFRADLLKKWQEMVAWHEKKPVDLKVVLKKRIDGVFQQAEAQRDQMKKWLKKAKLTDEKKAKALKNLASLELVVGAKKELLNTDLANEDRVKLQLQFLKNNAELLEQLEQNADRNIVVGGGFAAAPSGDPFEDAGGEAPELPNAVPAPSVLAGAEVGDGDDYGDGWGAGGGIPAAMAKRKGGVRRAGQPEPQIKLQKWNPDTPYLKRLRQAVKDENSVAQLEDLYFKLKKDYSQSSGFYLDVAQFFAEQKQDQLALRILSTVAELDAENVGLLRILAHRYDQLGKLELAELLFREVLTLRDDEPQSYRDLALVLEKKGEVQEAADLLWDVSMSVWHERMHDFQLITLTELNGLIAKHADKVKTDNYDSRFLKNLDCDVRIVLTWDADNTDMDLWVTDLLGETCDYSHNLTATNGRMSDDMTRGYGPEVFMIKKALPGAYEVEIDYFGNHRQTLAGETTVQASLITNWGRPNEKRQAVTLRLKGEKEVIKVGKLEFKK